MCSFVVVDVLPVVICMYSMQCKGVISGVYLLGVYLVYVFGTVIVLCSN